MNNKINKRRIVFIIGSMRRGGAERVISILANNYAERGWQVDILTLLDDSNDYELDSNINVMPICNKFKSRIRQLPKWMHSIRKYTVENNPDVIVSFIGRINIITILSCIGLSQRIIVSERNDPTADGRSIIVRIGTHLLYPIADRVVFQTKWAKSCFSKKIQNKGIIIPNPIHITTEALSTKEKKIVAVGRLLEQKNHAMLIRAFKKVHDDHPQYKLYIYGEGELRDKLTKQIAELELTQAVLIPGNISNIHEEIKDAEMFVLSSDYEGLSNALLEAMMMGLPCISTDCAGSNEVIQNGENGILVPVGSEEELVKAIKLLISDDNTKYKISRCGIKKANDFKVNIIIKNWINIIEE